MTLQLRAILQQEIASLLSFWLHSKRFYKHQTNYFAVVVNSGSIVNSNLFGRLATLQSSFPQPRTR